ncbi:MAG: alpha amylase C-terminal domain-containing protein [Bryobacteraceae bacterium]
MEEARSRIASLEVERAAEQESSAAELNEARTCIASLEERAAELEEARSRIASLEAERAAEQQSSADELNEARTCIASLEERAAELEEARSRIASLEAEAPAEQESSAAELNEARTRIASLEERAAELEEARSRIASLEVERAAEQESSAAELNEARTRIASLETEHAAERATLTTQLEQAQSRSAAVERERLALASYLQRAFASARQLTAALDEGRTLLPAQLGARGFGEPEPVALAGSGEMPRPVLPRLSLEKTPAEMPRVPTESALERLPAVRFQFWCPGADSVSVAGDFNRWDAETHPLTGRGDGWWSGEIEGVQGGQHYRFCVRRGDRVDLYADPYGREFGKDGSSVLPGPLPEPGAFERPALAEMVLYQLDTGGFSGGAEEGRVIGDVVERLAALREIGINGISLLPSPAPGWGYRAGRPFETGNEYGGAAEIRGLVDAAHGMGMAIFLDVEYHRVADAGPAGLRAIGAGPDRPGGIFCYDDGRGETPSGAWTRPDYGRPEVRRYFSQNALYWLRDLGFDGLRLDRTGLMQWIDPAGEERLPEGRELLAEIAAAVAAEAPGCWLIAEDRLDDASITRPAEEGGLGFDAQWDSRFARLARASVGCGTDGGASAVDMASEAIGRRLGGRPMARVVYTESHVEAGVMGARVPQAADPGNPESREARKKSTLAAMLAFTSPGIPMLLQGQETLEAEPYVPGAALRWDRGRPLDGVALLYRDLIHLRRNAAGETAGLTGEHVEVHHRDTDSGVVAWRRWLHAGVGDDVIVVGNFSATPRPAQEIGVPGPGLWEVRFNSDSSFYGADNGDFLAPAAPARAEPLDGMPYRITVGVDAWSGLILSQSAAG